MASKKTSKKEEAKTNYSEFKFSGKVFDYSGRIYPKTEGKGKVVARYGLSLTLNGVLTIKGVHLVETEDSFFLKFPSYKSGEDYKSYFFIDKELNEEIDNLTDAIVKCIPE